MKERDIIGYPLLEHPLFKEKKELKEKYLKLMAYFSYKYCSNDKDACEKVKSLAEVLLPEYSEGSVENPQNSASAILKTRFTPFRFFSYRYVFLFDSILLFASNSKKDAEAISEECKSWVNKRFHKKIDEIVRRMFDNNMDFAKRNLITDEMIKSWEIVKKYHASTEKKIVFTATMSAGKSTLINAIIGRELSSAKKAACTSSIIEFCSLPSNRDAYYIYSGDNEIQGDGNFVQNYLKNNSNSLEVYGYFDSELSETKIRLVDTPGINSSRNPEHKKITREALKSCKDATIVYVIPVENYGAEDDYNHLKYIKKNVEYSDIIFVVNMIDTCDFEDDSLTQIMEDIKEHLISIGFENPRVYPISAKAGFELKHLSRDYVITENERASAEEFSKKFMKDEYRLLDYYPQIGSRDEYSKSERVDLSNTGLIMFEKLLLKNAKGE